MKKWMVKAKEECEGIYLIDAEDEEKARMIYENGDLENMDYIGSDTIEFGDIIEISDVTKGYKK